MKLPRSWHRMRYGKPHIRFHGGKWRVLMNNHCRRDWIMMAGEFATVRNKVVNSGLAPHPD